MRGSRPSVLELIAWLAVALAVLPDASAAQARAPRVAVRVRQIAGSTLYLDIGTRNGLLAGDTLTAYTDTTKAAVGRLRVTAATETRSALTFAGAPFAVTRGMDLVLQLRRTPEEAAPELLEAVGRPAPAKPSSRAGAAGAAADTSARGSPRTPRAETSAPASFSGAPHVAAHGRWTLELSALRSTTQLGGAQPTRVARTFATPALGMDITVPDAVGRLRLRADMRLSYRYSDRNIVQPATAARVYALALEGNLGPRVRVSLGRFYSPVESYSGVWDGALVRVGSRRGFGVGAMAGFEPNLWDQRPSTKRPKATLFMDGRSRGDGWSWAGNLSVTGVRPRDGEPNHTFVGATERLSAGPLWIAHDLEVDRDPTNGRWRISRLRIQASADLWSGLALHSGVSRSEPWLYGLSGSPFGLRSEQADLGLSLRKGEAYASVDGSVSKDAVGDRSSGVTGTFSLGRLPGVPGLSAYGSVAQWTGRYGNMLSAAPSLRLSLDAANLRLGYRIERSDYLKRTILTHAIDASADIDLSSGVRLSGDVRVQIGGALSNQALALRLYKVF